MMNILKKIPSLINKENLKTFGKAAGKVGKSIVIEGVKGVAIKGAQNFITTSFDRGAEGVKSMTLDDYLGKKKSKLVISKSKSEEKGAKVEVEAEYVVVEEPKQD